ncbi:MAG: NAD-dependent epimerase/dehydratase family protein, partial [Bacteroidota bacterium]
MTHSTAANQDHPRILLTGGSGFLGMAIVRELLDANSPVKPSLLRIFDLVPYPGPPDARIEMVTGNICDAAAVSHACRGIDLVIHSAAMVDWGTKPEREVLAVNFGGTENVMHGCREHKVRHLVYTSSLDAIFGGKSLVNIDETIPYPEKHPNMYCRSKCLSEKLILENGASHDKEKPTAPPGGATGLTTCILRPADIYGQGDPFHIGSLIDMAKGGFYVRLGDGSSKSQHVYVGNMAWAHVLASKALLDGNPAISGNAYFITDGQPS